MKELTTYLTFDGTCREAMTFYETCLGAHLVLLPFDEKMCGPMPDEAKNRTMHACLSRGGKAILMASDSMPGMPVHTGDNFSVNIDCESREEIQSLFTAFGKDGKVVMPLQDMFWGAYWGMLKDRFGIQWMFNQELPKPLSTT